ncbi:MAG: BatD family protein [Ginsengibacter sp.]
MNSFLPSRFIKLFALLILPVAIFTSYSSFAQAKFSVVCPSKIGKNDILQIQFKVENGSNVESIIPPSFKGFTIVSGPNQERSVSNINGRVSQYVAVGFSLQPSSAGKFTIGAATARVDGKEYHSNPVTVQVTKTSSAQPNNNTANTSPFANFNFDSPSQPVTRQFDDYILKPGENVAQKTQKNLFLKLDASKTSCYVGEPIVAAYKLYTRLHSETTITDAPSFNGFSVSDLNVNNNASLEKYNGRPYNVYTLRKVELYPLQPGNITLDPVVADNTVTFIKSEYANSQNSDDFFNMLENFGDAAIPASGLVEQKIILKTDPLVITVKPLPAQGKPSGFKGAVGNFEISSSLEKDHITTDDAGSLSVVIKGEGNIQLINAPVINWDKGMDGYDAKLKDDVDKTKFPMSGSKIFTFPFTVSRPGDYKIDSITFSYFDPVSATYKTLHTNPLEVHVIKGTGTHQNPLVKNNLQKSGFFSNSTELIAGMLLFLGMIALIFFIIIRKKRNKSLLEKNIKLDDLKNKGEENKKEFIIPENPLLEAHDKLIIQNSREFFHTLNTSLKKYLSRKFKIPVSELTRKRLNEELDKSNVSVGTTLLLTSLLDEIQINLYAPPSGVNHMNAIFEKASEVVSLVDKQIGNN